MKLSKIMLKVVDERTDLLEWTHFCYVSEHLLHLFMEKFKCEKQYMVNFIIKWCKEDFNLDLSMSTKRDILVLKELILDQSRRIYPHLYIHSKRDNQGWSRAWMMRHMEREVKRFAK